MDLYERAHKTIKKNFTNKGLVAGSTHFSDLWARDALYACWGLHDKEPAIVKKH